MQGQLSTYLRRSPCRSRSTSCPQTVIAGAHERAAALAAQVTVAVVDEGGHLQALGRMADAAPLSARIAETKAASVALFRRDGAALRQMQEASPGSCPAGPGSAGSRFWRARGRRSSCGGTWLWVRWR